MRAESLCMTELGLDISLSGRGFHRESRWRESIPCGVLARCPTGHGPPNTQRFAGASSPGSPSRNAPAGSRFYVPAAKSDTSCPRQRWHPRGARPTRAGSARCRAAGRGKGRGVGRVRCLPTAHGGSALGPARSALSVRLCRGTVGCSWQPAGPFPLRPRRTRVQAARLPLRAKPLPRRSQAPSSSRGVLCAVWAAARNSDIRFALRGKHLGFSCLFLCWIEFRHIQPRRRSGDLSRKD